MGINNKLLAIQSKLKAPKNKTNSFGNYKYRSCEDILEAVKPLLKENNCTLTLTDSIELIGDRHYVKATALLADTESEETISNTAFARETASKKGQDDSQVTGTASSYARKYALNGLLLIDDTKDEDTDDLQNEKKARIEKEEKAHKSSKAEDEKKNAEMVASVNPLLLPDGKGMTKERLDFLEAEKKRTGITDKTLLSTAKVAKYEDMSEATYIAIMNKLAITKDAE